MKINSNVSQQVQKSKQISKSSNHKIPLNKGNVFRATVTESSGDMLKLKLPDGRVFNTHNLSGRDYDVMKSYEFEVVEDTPQVEVRMTKGQDKELINALSKMFSNGNANISDSVLEAAKALSKWGIPLSVENIEAMVKESKQVDILIGLIKSNLLSIDKMPANMPFKDVLVNYFSSETATQEPVINDMESLKAVLFSKISVDNTHEQQLLDINIQSNESNSNNESNKISANAETLENTIKSENMLTKNNISATVGLEKSSNALMSNMSADTLETTNDKTSIDNQIKFVADNSNAKQEQSNIVSENETADKNALNDVKKSDVIYGDNKELEFKLIDDKYKISKEDMTKEIISLLQGISPEILAFHKKVNMPNSIENIAIFEALLGKQFSIAEQINQLGQSWAGAMSSFSPSTQTLISNWLAESIANDNNSLIDKSHNLQRELINILKSIKEDKSFSEKPILQDSFYRGEQVHKSISYLKQVSDSIAYMQLPIVVNDDIRSVDLFVKKNANKQSKDDEMTIFLSLDTHNIDRVQVYISYTKTHININFRVENSEVMKIFDEKKNILKNALSQITKKEIILSSVLKQKQRLFENVAEFFTSENHTINVTV